MRLYTLLVDACMVQKPCAAFQSYNNNNPIHGQRSQITAKKGAKLEAPSGKMAPKMRATAHVDIVLIMVRRPQRLGRANIYAPLHCDHSKILMRSEQVTYSFYVIQFAPSTIWFLRLTLIFIKIFRHDMRKWVSFITTMRSECRYFWGKMPIYQHICTFFQTKKL